MYPDGVNICTRMCADTHVHTVWTSFNDNRENLDISREKQVPFTFWNSFSD